MRVGSSSRRTRCAASRHHAGHTMRAATVTAAVALLLAAAGRAIVAPAPPPPPPPYHPTSCPADYPGQQETVLYWAHMLLNGTFQAGAGYANQVFLRDTATFIDIALDNVGEANATVRPLLLKLIAFQRLTGDIGCEGIGFSGPLSCMDKSTVEVDQETSYIIMIQKYVDKTNDIALLRLPVTSKADSTSRSVLERMERMLQYLMSTTVNASFPEQSGRLDPKYGLIWGATRAVSWSVALLNTCWPTLTEHDTDFCTCRTGVISRQRTEPTSK
eukprot:COSAG02_NODE_1254_length_13584_cov_15.001483_17_plen_273_part_00